ncbi:MAG: flavodoxin family protein [Tannerellaceae bacterium]|jgi:multimeric flavodoxin WrbA|nr:flavodoxin family protein [Tannerellaceae bacterium]
MESNINWEANICNFVQIFYEDIKMKKVIAINGSPRKKGNTTTLLQHALDGAVDAEAETEEVVHLYGLNYKGCSSCFSCKRKWSGFVGECAMKDELSPILKKVMESDIVIMGTI